MNPIISVILPVFNAAETVRSAAESILNGTFQNIELIIANDGSTDDSLNQIHSLNDPRVRVLNLPHQGVAVTANTAAAACRADWIARMDADDWSTPDRLEKQWNLAQSECLDVVSGQVKILDRQGAPVKGMQRYEKWLNGLLSHEEITAQRFVELPIVNPTILARKEFFLNQCRHGPFPEDYDHWLRVLGNPEVRVGKVDSVILHWMDHSKRLTRSDERYSLQAFDKCRRMHLLNGPLLGQSMISIWGAGSTGKPWIRWAQKVGLKVNFVVEVAPGKIGQTIHGVPVIAPDQLEPASPDSTPMLVAVGAAGARKKIRTYLSAKEYHPSKDVWFVA